MDELIKQITDKLGIDRATADAAVAKIMSMIKQNAGDDLFGKIAGAIPGAEASAKQGLSGDAEPAGGGMLGKLAGMASAAMGGKAGAGLELGTALASLGINSEKLQPLLTLVLTFLKSKLGDDVVDQILSKFPMLKTLVG